jgi:hypothetical protein
MRLLGKKVSDFCTKGTMTDMTESNWREWPATNRGALEATLDALPWLESEHSAIVALLLSTASSLDEEYTAAKSSSYLQALRMLRSAAPEGQTVDPLDALLRR